MSTLRRRIAKLKDAARPEPEGGVEWGRRLENVRRSAEQENERFYRYLAIERRTAYLESVGYEGHTAEELRDENFLYPDDEPPFEIAPDGKVFCSRDGLPVTTYQQTLAEQWYWEEVEDGGAGLIHDEEAEAFHGPSGELALSRTRFDLRYLLGPPREKWIIEEWRRER